MMIRVTIDSRELKEMVNKVTAAVPKKSYIPGLRKVYFKVNEEGRFHVFGGDLEQVVDVYTPYIVNTTPYTADTIGGGTVGIDIDDIPLITKISGRITFSETGQGTVQISNGKKSVEIKAYNYTEEIFPMLKEIKSETETTVLETSNLWMLETVDNLVTFTSKENKRKPVATTLNFNISERKAEACDGHRIAIRDFGEKCTAQSEINNVLLINKAVPVLKKLLNTKTVSNIKMSVIGENGKYVKISGNDFTYTVRQVEGQYFNITRIIDSMQNENQFNCTVKDLTDIMKYDVDFLKASKSKGNNSEPVIFARENGEIYTFMETSKGRVVDKIDVSNMVWQDNHMIAFNPQYILDALKIVDTENPLFYTGNKNSGMIIKGEEYRFMILPVRIKDGMTVDYIKGVIGKKRAA